MITLLALLLLSASAQSTDVVTCSGGPVFGFVRDGDRLDAGAKGMLDRSIDAINVPLWRSGWITITPTVAAPIDQAGRALADRRKTAIMRYLFDRGVTPDRIRFETFRPSSPGGADADVYASALSTPRSVWDAHVAPGVMC